MKCGHTSITNGCKHCRELEDKWYKNTEADDIESREYDDRPLKVWHNNAFKKISPLEIEITQDYYSQASELLHNYEFKNETIRRIWELHCEGFSRLKIELAISKMPHAYKQSAIRLIIMDLEREFDW